MNPTSDVPAYFACDVFNKLEMKKRLLPEVYEALEECMNSNEPLPLSLADLIAEAMKEWALEKGATHYTHWFHPMTGFTAEKHDSFISPGQDGTVIMEFSGKALVRGEPDASALPSGGLRATFEARGFTAWDPTASVFVRDGSLYIPSCFYSYTGAVLDMKTPLLRSIRAVSREAIRILRVFGDQKTKRVIPCVGAEQEYFLLPKGLFDQREDLQLTGRTLFGAPPPKGQELNDHYFATIRTQVSEFMQDLDEQLWRLGILSKTKHNEAAPCQHELAPVFTDANNACDANQLTMLVMKKCAAKHGLVCLLHEKPFAGINGSGKHNNWSLCTDSGENLFAPGNTFSDNARFLLFIAAFVKGVDQYQDLLRCSVASFGNDSRLGGHEAPPAVVSIYLGSKLSKIIDSICNGTIELTSNSPSCVTTLPISIGKDTADRNRTSPLAFTGNKFEFRMPGSSQSIAEPNTILNTIMAEELRNFADILECSDNVHSSVQALIKDTFSKHHRIVFNGDSYAQDWKREAKRRFLDDCKSTVQCLKAYTNPKNCNLLQRHGIYTHEEFHARRTVQIEAYCKTVRIEALTCIDMVLRQILPASIAYSKELCAGINNKKAMELHAEAETSLARQLSVVTDAAYESCVKLQAHLENVPEEPEQAVAYYHDVIAAEMGVLRSKADILEKLSSKRNWPYPTYADLLYY